MTFITNLNKFSLLTEKEEIELAKQLNKSTGKQYDKILSKLIKHNLRLVVNIAYKYNFAVDDVEDLIQEGSIGLQKGIQKWDHTRGVRLGNYCYLWIRAYIIRYIMNNANIVKIGTTTAQRKLYFNLAKIRAKYNSMGINISDDELAKELGVKVEELKETEQRLLSPTVRLDASIDADKQDNNNFIERNNLNILDENNPSDLFESYELHLAINKFTKHFLTCLSERDKDVFKRRFLQDTPDTLEKISNDWSLTRERIRQVEANLKDKFKKFILNTEMRNAV